MKKIMYQYINVSIYIYQITLKKKFDFLDVQVIRSGNQLITDLFVKPTNTHQYLHASSCHVYHSERAIPYSQTLRFNGVAWKTGI